MDGHQVAIRDDPRNRVMNVRMRREERLEKPDRCIAACFRQGVVLDVAGGIDGFRGDTRLP
jgi:hypothetical protein